MKTDVLIAGGGPVGLTAAIELTRRGIDCRIVDPLAQPPQYAKAVGVQPRTLEVFESMGILTRILDAAIQMRGQIIYVNGENVGQIDFTIPSDVPFGFIAIPQYAAERILRDELALRGVHVERGLRITGFDQDADGVRATLAGDGGEQTVQASYLIGADGAHSTVRKALGLTFEGAAFEEQYMLGDVEVDWSMPRGYGIRAMHQTDGATDDLLVCIPLPGRGRYRMSMLVPPELAAESSGGVAHGFEGDRTPELRHIQAVLDRLSPEPTTARNLRWSSVFRISHRIVDAYGRGRVFVAGDAAHIHPPTGAQGMNTGIQDAHNLSWKLALAVSGRAAPGLLDSYDAERRPVGEEVVGRTVRSAREGIGSDSNDIDFIIRREAQLLIDYFDSPIVAANAGRRAPDATGLTRDAVTGSLRLFTLFGPSHTVLLYAAEDTGPADVETFEAAAETAVAAAKGDVTVYLIAAPGAAVATTVLPVIRDAGSAFAAAYPTADRTAFVIRPDGYLGFAGAHTDTDGLAAHLRTIFGPEGRA
ncbi:pentachlorophenol monooxygenase [Mycolicibacterium moriokaense]|uniref:3-(3-hydroxyphenyl)propionate hydroxylase n=1 Tax=Mycolicibacterium moriokaense TaxID=39691 RepID=A0AAD1HCG3_9MYCO|nr:FAD-dependent monooxygenase [Mycolicibacterium moriokaense]MCV7038525.1 FAD-dependent monooxygenase [Mycolicibacterium moriokaense]ORB24818.1 pentachlorophenol monooxygenase [Mycolicibacterium moriokaense]BBX02351.1 3-(3-hydroxyphenyl)propionate hydroxylase [Mycolicibacterium moriokaense]